MPMIARKKAKKKPRRKTARTRFSSRAKKKTPKKGPHRRVTTLRRAKKDADLHNKLDEVNEPEEQATPDAGPPWETEESPPVTSSGPDDDDDAE